VKRKIELSTHPQREFKRSKMEQGFYGENHLIWIDCEMTDLDPVNGRLLEIACVITAPDLYEVARHPSIIINVSDEILGSMGPWCTKQHQESGLVAASKESTITTAQAEQMLLRFVRNYTKAGSCPMAGNSIFMDRLFIMNQMPEFHKHFHYRNVDVSSIKELVRRWYPKIYGESPTKKFLHRCLNDIEDSIAELQYYRSTVFRK
jgi:oligoribonuclease